MNISYLMFRFVSFPYLLKLTWLSLRKGLWVELVIITLTTIKIMEIQAEKEFFDSESSPGELFSKSDN